MHENDSTGDESAETTNTAASPEPGDTTASAPPARKRAAKKATAKKTAAKKTTKKAAAKKTTRKKATAPEPDLWSAADTAPAEAASTDTTPVGQPTAETAPVETAPAEQAAAQPAAVEAAPEPVAATEAPAAQVEPAAEAEPAASESAASAAEPAGEEPSADEPPARRARQRRGSASRPAGPPEPVEDPRAAVFLPPRPVTTPPPVAEVKEAEAEEPEHEPEPVAETDQEDSHADDGEDTDDRPRRRRRRGGRGRRRRSGQAQDEAEAEETEPVEPVASDDDADEAGEDDTEDAAGQESSKSSRRRRRRRRRSGSDDGEPSPDDPPNTVVRVREAREAESEVTALKGSTRLEAKRQRRREGRDPSRRRPPVLTESEFLARREAVERTMIVRQVDDRTQIAVLEDGVLAEHYVERGAGQSYVGNVYLGRVQNVLPSMEAAFIDIGRGRNAVLYAGEVNFSGVDLGGQPKRIEAALKSGQSVVVQVTKGPVGQKGARLSAQIGLPGRYLVYSPDSGTAGISRKLPDKERDRLKQVLKQTLPENGGVIVRTAAEGASEDELARDVNRLVAQWDAIQQKAKTASAPSLLYEEPDLTVRVIRDVFNEDFGKLVVAGDASWDVVEPYIAHVAPHLADRVEKWTSDKDLFAEYRIDEQLAKALDRKVWLPSGGSLVIDRTEAMTVIDVNTGKFTGQGGNLEETVTKNNLEAAEEIVRQLRLRDIGGIIVVDFIDMVLESNRDLVLRRLVECLARDRTRHQVAEVTSLGLVQMTRKRIGQGLLESFSTQCECCNGRGIHVSLEPVAPEQRGGNGGGRSQGGGGRRGKKKQQQDQKDHKDQKDQKKNREGAQAIAMIAAASG